MTSHHSVSCSVPVPQKSTFHDLPESGVDRISVDVAISPQNNLILVDPSTAYTFVIPRNLTQELVDADPQLKRLQLDLLILTSFNENSTLHWRPAWFKQRPFNQRFWTLQNPPNVATERLPCVIRGQDSFTRKIKNSDPPSSAYIKSWDHWRCYCDLYGVPYDFLCEDQIRIMRLGLPSDNNTGLFCAPPIHPLYPEPQALGQGRYILDPSTYTTHLSRKFHHVDHAAAIIDQVEVVVVHSNGALAVEPRDQFFMHESQWTHFDGYGGYRLDTPQRVDESAPKEQGPGRRWSYLPWTREQEMSCKPLRIGLRGLKQKKEEREEVEPEKMEMAVTEVSKL